MSTSDWNSVNAWRKEQRAVLRAARLAIPPAERRTLQARIIEQLGTEFPELRGCTIGAYWAFRGEVNLLPFLRDQVAAGGKIALPVVVQRNAPVEWWAWTPDTPMKPGIWNIPVPAERKVLAPDALLVPLLAFDDACYRLGNGGGYYDRTLAQSHPKPFCIGIGQDLGRLRSIQPQPHDLPLDVVLTESGLHWPATDAAEEGNADSSSPVCYADEAPAAYAGYLSESEISALLSELLTQHLRLLHAAAADSAGPLWVTARRQLLRGASLLQQAGASAPNAAEQNPALTLDELQQARHLLTVQLAQCLPTIRDAAVHHLLQRVRQLHMTPNSP